MITCSYEIWRKLVVVCLVLAICGCKSTSQSSLTTMPMAPSAGSPESGTKNSQADFAAMGSKSASRESCASQSSTNLRKSNGLEVKSANKSKSKNIQAVNRAAGDCKSSESGDKEPLPAAPSGLGNQSDSETAKTDGEMTQQLDHKLTSSIAAFQRQMLRNNQQVDQSQMGDQSMGDASVTGDGEGAGRSSSGSQAGGDLSGFENGIDSNSGGGLVPPLPPSQRAGIYKSKKVSVTRTPKGLGSGYDEVVARQLHEAAESETDPLLREKLWQEYRQYTGDTAADP